MEPTQWASSYTQLDPAQLPNPYGDSAPNPYEDTLQQLPVLPPPPPPKKRHWMSIITVAIASIVIIGIVGFIATMAHGNSVPGEQPQVQTPKIVATAMPTATPIPPTPVVIIETATPDVPTATPIPTVSSAQGLFDQFIAAGIAMGNSEDTPTSWWSACCNNYPGRGSISFVDTASGGQMTISLFYTANGSVTDYMRVHNYYGVGDQYVGSCMLTYNSSSTNLTPYEQVMNEYCPNT